ncbi:MAG TPA: hypothetical protein VFX98_07625 [Longimicrobiaceae bacterium]|nr:hypothetical protein [Longimicrobiaceae bacterium]
MNKYARAFQITMWAGIVANIFVLGIPSLFAPDWMLRTAGLDIVYPDLYPRFAAWLLILLSLFYIPGANDINRYRANAILAVVSRFAGVIFFIGMVLFLKFSPRYLMNSLYDGIFGIPGAIFLVLAIRSQQRQAAATPPEPRKEAPHAVDTAQAL